MESGEGFNNFVTTVQALRHRVLTVGSWTTRQGVRKDHKIKATVCFLLNNFYRYSGVDH